MNWQDGDEKAGYRIWIDAPRRLLRFRFWGMWKLPLGVSYRDNCFDAIAIIARRGRWFVLADLSEYPVQKPDVQACHAATMVRAREAKVVTAANLVAATLSQMQIRRLSEESGLPEFAFFQSESKALAYIDELNAKAD